MKEVNDMLPPLNRQQWQTVQITWCLVLRDECHIQ
jgi:hypothetical protein